MRTAILTKNLTLQPLRMEYKKISYEERYLICGSGWRIKVALHRDNPPKLRFIGKDLVCLNNVYVYFNGRNRLVFAYDKVKNMRDLLLYVRLRLHKEYDGLPIRINVNENRLYCDYKVEDKYDKEFNILHGLVYIKSGERMSLTDYLDDNITTIYIDNSKGGEPMITRLNEF